MKITKRQLRRIIKEEKAKLSEISAEQAARINAEQNRLQSQAEVTRLMGDLHTVIERLIDAMGETETALELEAIANELME